MNQEIKKKRREKKNIQKFINTKNNNTNEMKWRRVNIKEENYEYAKLKKGREIKNEKRRK